MNDDISSLIVKFELDDLVKGIETYYEGDSLDGSLIYKLELEGFPTEPGEILTFINGLLKKYELPVPDQLYVTKTHEMDMDSGEIFSYLVEAVATYPELRIEFAPFNEEDIDQPARGRLLDF